MYLMTFDSPGSMCSGMGGFNPPVTRELTSESSTPLIELVYMNLIELYQGMDHFESKFRLR
jgi:hypothetical protein